MIFKIDSDKKQIELVSDLPVEDIDWLKKNYGDYTVVDWIDECEAEITNIDYNMKGSVLWQTHRDCGWGKSESSVNLDESEKSKVREKQYQVIDGVYMKDSEGNFSQLNLLANGMGTIESQLLLSNVDRNKKQLRIDELEKEAHELKLKTKIKKLKNK